MIKNLLLLVQILFVLGLTISSAIPLISHDFYFENVQEIEKTISPQKTTQSFKAIEVKAERALSELSLRDQFRGKFLKLIPLTLGFVCFCKSAENKPFSKQLSYGVLFSESYLKLFNDPSSHPLIPQGPPKV